MGDQTEINQLGMLSIIVMGLGFDARVRKVIDFHLQSHLFADRFDNLSQVKDGELFGELIKNAELTWRSWIEAGKLHTANRIPNIKETSCLSAAPVNSKRTTNRSLRTKSVKNRPKILVVIEAVDQRLV